MSQSMLSLLNGMKQVAHMQTQAESLLQVFQNQKNRKSILNFLERRKAKSIGTTGEISNSGSAVNLAREEGDDDNDDNDENDGKEVSGSRLAVASPVRRRFMTIRALSPIHIRTHGSSGSLNIGSTPPPPIMPKSNSFKIGSHTPPADLKNVPLLDWSTVEVARQMTLIDHALFQKVLPKECFNRAWNSENRRARAPNIHAIIKRSNDVCSVILPC